MKDRSPIVRAEANRRDARKSTGPTTEPGEQRARFNAFRHGLTGQTFVLPLEDRENYEATCQVFFADLQPKGALETQFVQTIADASWRLNRAAALETSLFAFAIQNQDGLIDTGDPRAGTALAMAAALHDEGRTLSNMNLYCQRVSRQRERAIEQLRELQAERRRSEAPARAGAAHGFDFANSGFSRRRASGLHLVKSSQYPAGNGKTSASNPQFRDDPRVS